MHLKRLDIFGFKSFADKLEIVFPAGITAVVGPNGSGKSNISDAIRWVLGEQSIRTLRGARMEDIIFAGSEQRKPLGMAEVTLVIDNAEGKLPLDFSEVSVTRRVYRSGESEFFINRAPVRLREIQDIFLDTGLGKEAYSMIGQGKIDAILSARSEERRAIFEEAAGIMRYKQKKAVAVRKMDETEANMLRINDIIGELGAQLGPMSAQAAVATKYLDLCGSLRHLEVNCFGKELERLEAEEQRVNNELQSQMESLAVTAGAESVEEARLEQDRAELTKVGEQLESLQEQMAETTRTLEQSSGSEKLLQERQANLVCERNRHESKLVELADRSARLSTELTTLEARLGTVRQNRGMAMERQQREEALLKEHAGMLADVNTKIEEARRNMVANINAKAAVRQQLEAVVMTDSFSEQQRQQDEQRLAKARGALAEIEQRLETVERVVRQNKATGATIDTQIAELENKASEAERVSQELAAQREALVRQIAKTGSHLSALEEMEQARQGYSEGVRALLGNAAGGGNAAVSDNAAVAGIHGTVADLIQVNEGFEIAMDVVLGSALQHIVIENEASARKAIEWLKSSSRGRATFLPLDLIEERGRGAAFAKNELDRFGAVPAVTVVQTDAHYSKVIGFLLGNTLVAPDLSQAVAVARNYHKSVRVVTMAGDLVNPGGSMTGGSRERRGAGLIERKKDLEDLRAKLASLEQEDRESETQLRQASSNRDALRATLRELQVSRHQLELEEAKSSKELESVAAERARMLKDSDALLAELASRTDHQSDRQQQRAELQSKLGALDSEYQAIEEKIKAFEEELSVRQKSKDADYRSFAESQAGLAGAEQEELGLLNQFRSLESNRGDLEAEAANCRAEVERLNAEELALAKSIQDEVAVRSRLAQDKVALEESMRSLRGVRAERTEALHLLEEELKAKRKNVTELQNRVHRLELRQNSVTRDIEGLRNHLEEQYGQTWQEYRVGDFEGALSGNRAKIESLKSEIKSLGTVNLAAIDDYARIKERYEFLQKQYDDLVEARKDLANVIEEIEQTTARRFTDTFDQVKAAFSDIFAQLFEGGQADVYLLDPEKPLESGIEITAQPPGKRQQSLTLLSGGERALTAIALLFAILRVKPTPFCILDEIDATLDEANVHRFADLLSEFSKDLQLIIVTHRRGTMELADAIYGVTMEEMGVSKLLSLQLKKQAG